MLPRDGPMGRGWASRYGFCIHDKGTASEERPLIKHRTHALVPISCQWLGQQKAQALRLLFIRLHVLICISSIHIKHPAVVNTMLGIKLHVVLLQGHASWLRNCNQLITVSESRGMTLQQTACNLDVFVGCTTIDEPLPCSPRKSHWPKASKAAATQRFVQTPYFI